MTEVESTLGIFANDLRSLTESGSDYFLYR